ncbi:ComEC/Rec2 family competence protein [Arthrobacter sp. ISL-30]|uniref:ComEC/Rec2 family competence protein n=1 Tax=Arthrobacter sp. ISL-30 TaxID=2819109 RepID=UPI001BE84EEB|nr:ComEC/Rec2 family competence protein [Arthrobacter sp. ISL-30]MBT2512749.1 ComEC/Rec2 family competence protein [Arthrobacter sp. ISL-30]
MDLRLVPAALLAWGSAVAGTYLPAGWLLVLGGFLIVASIFFLHWATPSKRRWPHISRPKRKPMKRSANSLRSTLGLACMLAAGVTGHNVVLGVERENSPTADLAADHAQAVVDVVVTGTPRALGGRGQSGEDGRWAVTVQVVHVRAGGLNIREDARLTVMGSQPWAEAMPGQRLRATGRLKESRPGQPETAILSASSKPGVVEQPAGPLSLPSQLREALREASAWLPPDAAGLLPGMVTGDIEGLAEDLEAAMKPVGMTHLTAVSGANCSLVLGSLLLLARTLRLARPLAASAAVSGLGCFVLIVGPDPSVLRAALMGAIGVVALASGRRGRSLGFLCLAVIGLLLLDPRLGATYGFLLSVLATLGIVLLGARIASWLNYILPLPLAAAVSVPLSAQLFCSPAIVALQPGFSSYALIANIVAAPFVAPVTLLGTAALPLLPVWHGAGHVLIAVAGFCAGCVAAVARFFAGSPGAMLPWAEGLPGIGAMALMSVLTLGFVWAITHPAAVLLRVLRLHAHWVSHLPIGKDVPGVPNEGDETLNRSVRLERF